jgi:hypothetical protein
VRVLPKSPRGRVAVGGALLLLASAMLGLPVTHSVTYCAVSDPADAWPGRSWLSDHFPFGAPDYVIHDVRLYLKVQSVWYTQLSPMVRFTDWDINGVEEFRRRHPSWRAAGHHRTNLGEESAGSARDGALAASARWDGDLGYYYNQRQQRDGSLLERSDSRRD